MFLVSGLAMILLTCMVGQLNSQVNGCHCMLDYINNWFAVFTFWVAMAIEFSGLLHASYLIQFLVAKQSRLSFATTPAILPLLQERMDLTPSQLFQLNQCRLALQVYFLSDITTGHGQQILPEYLSPPRQPSRPRNSKWRWPQARPTRNDWTLWRTTLLQCWPTGRLPHGDRLGPWLTDPHLHYVWYYDSSTSTLWGKQGDLWQRHVPQVVRQRTYFVHHSDHTDRPATANAPTSITRFHHNKVRHTGTATPPAPLIAPPSIRARTESLGPAGWPLRTAWFPQEGQTIAHAIQRGTAIGVSDGSYKPSINDDIAAAAWLVTDLAYHHTIGGVVRTSGTAREVNAYRAELQGLHAMLLGITVVCDHHHITQGSIILGLDNEAGAYLCQDPFQDPPPITLNHVDLIRACRRMIAALPIQVHLEHVRGHQDDRRSTQPLSPMEQLNVVVDSMAKAHLDTLLHAAHHQTLGPCPTPLYAEGARLYAQDIKLTSNPGNAIRQAIFDPLMRQDLDSKGLLSATAFHTVDWYAIHQASHSAAPLFRLWAVKNACGQCAVGKWMQRWQFWDDRRCPSGVVVCGQDRTLLCFFRYKCQVVAVCK